MTKSQLVVSALLLVLFLIACSPKVAQAPAPPPMPQAPAPAAAPAPEAPARAVWQVEWEKTLAAAKKEGRVVITTTLDSAGRTGMAQGLKTAYGIPVETIGGKGAEITARILAERRAGLYNYDVYIGGGTTALTSLKPAGTLDPVDLALILPDVTDPGLVKKIWWGERLWWVDAAHTHLASALSVNFPLAINTNLVKEGEIKSYRDLLDTRWRGKMIFNDPTLAGIGNTFVTFADAVLGWNYLVELVAKAEPIVMRDQRLMLDWLAHGKAALVVAPKIDVLTEFVGVGAPIKGIVPAEGTWLLGGLNGLSMFNRSPHPNAAKIFVNWSLGKEGQTIIVRAIGYQSNRLDVPADHLPPEVLRQPGVKYFVVSEEKVLLGQPAQMQQAKELLAPLMK